MATETMYANKEVIAFDGTLQGLSEQLELLKVTMPKSVAFVISNGEIMNRIRLTVVQLTDGSHTWDIELFKAKSI